MQSLLYLIGSFGYAVIYATLLSMHMYRYDPGEPNSYGLPILASSALVGIAALVGRAFNPIFGIVIGNLSDQTRSRWGRRRPFMAIALLPMLLGFVLVFTPPFTYPTPWNAVYLAIAFIIFFASFSTYMTPYLALIPEIAKTQSQRVKLTTLIAMCTMLGNAVGLVASPWLLQRYGFLNMALIIVAISLIALTLPLAIKEDPNLSIPERTPIWKSLQIAKNNYAFPTFVVNQIFVWITINIIYLSTNFLVVALLQRDIGFGTVANGALLAGAGIGFIPINILTKVWGKRATLSFSLIYLSLNLMLLSILLLLVKDILWLCILIIVLFGSSLSGLFVLPNAMLADIIDEDTNKTGVQRGAIYFGIQAIVLTVSSGIASLLVGVLLTLGKTGTQPLGVQLVYAAAGFFALNGAWSLKFYPIKK